MTKKELHTKKLKQQALG